MFKSKFFALILLACLLAACAPSAQAIQAAIAQTQAAWTPTPTTKPTDTIAPTATINPCSDRGWTDIVTYLSQYNLAEKNMVVGTSALAYLQSLENYKDKINAVIVDPCTEHARQLVISGLTNRIYVVQLILSGGDIKNATTAIVNGVKMVQDAETELNGLGLNVKLP